MIALCAVLSYLKENPNKQKPKPKQDQNTEEIGTSILVVVAVYLLHSLMSNCAHFSVSKFCLWDVFKALLPVVRDLESSLFFSVWVDYFQLLLTWEN